MERRDARKLNKDAKEEIHRQAIKLHYTGLNNTTRAKALEVHWSTVSGWVKRYKRSGFSELKAKRMGRTPGSGMQLSVSEQTKIKNKITEKNPEQLKMLFALWTREAVCDLIKKLTSKLLDLRQVGRYLKRWARRYAHHIELHYLPSYCPDLNPDEYLNCDLKTELAKRPERRAKGQWVKTVERTLLNLA